MRTTNQQSIFLKLNFTLAIIFFTGINIWAQSTLSTSSLQESMRVSLYQLSSTGNITLADGNLTNYDNSYSNGTNDDALKMNNFNENFAILRYSVNLAIEQRQKIVDSDTTFFLMWNMQLRNYRLIIIANNLEHPGLQGFFIDSYLNTSTPLGLNSQNIIDFSVNSDASSYNPQRFKIVFKNPTLTPLATLFNNFSGNLNGSKIELSWNVNNNSSIETFSLEHSIDRVHFTNILQSIPSNNMTTTTYNASDANYNKGDNFYRVRAVGSSGSAQYSQILKINGNGKDEEFTIYPNPITGNKINLFFTAKKNEIYKLAIYNNKGMSIQLNSIRVSKGQNIQTIELPSFLPKGNYFLKITTAENSLALKQITVL